MPDPTPSAPTAEMLAQAKVNEFARLVIYGSHEERVAAGNALVAALARSEPPTGEPVAISDDDIAHLRNLVNDTRIAAVESSAVYRALCALLAEARAPVAVPAGEPKERT